LSGIKAFSYLGIILLHTVTTKLYFPLRDSEEAEKFFNSLADGLINAMFYNVDTFLLISGLLVTRMILKELERYISKNLM
jgi:peptidoglycan/LPS O-acetylase OafA/YrhL